MDFTEADIKIALRTRGVGRRHVAFQETTGGEACFPWGRALATLWKETGNGQGFLAVLLGRSGVGKTQLSVEWLRHILRTTKDDKDVARFVDGWLGMHILYRKSSELFQEVRATFDRNDQSEREVVNRFCNVRALVIDEIDKRARTEFEQNTLFSILDERYANLRETIIISNDRTRRSFVGHQPDYLVSRLQESGLFIECNWPSFRER